jgi:hypothetical protein
VYATEQKSLVVIAPLQGEALEADNNKMVMSEYQK